MKKKSYTNFAVTDDALLLKTEQEPVKTNVAAIEAIRKEQCAAVKETFPQVHHTVTGDTTESFNEWSRHINNSLRYKKIIHDNI